MLRLVLAALLAPGLLAPPARAGGDDDEVRVTAACGRAEARLRLERDDDGIQARFELRDRGAGGLWRVTLVQERRVAWKGTATTTRGRRRFELRRTLPDLPGSDTVTAQAWGPRGAGCRVTATLPGQGP
jgi:hypothetical protein